MSFFDKIFKKKSNQEKSEEVKNPECIKMLELDKEISSLLGVSGYIAKSDYVNILKKYSDTIRTFSTLEKNDMLDEFCRKNGVKTNIARSVVALSNNFEETVKKHNVDYINNSLIYEKDYLDNILKEVDPVINLDEDQRKVVLADEDYTLVIAGAGAGKTTTVAAKVKYLVDRQNIDPSEILVISFTNKAVNELKEKINKELRIDCPIATFHSTGNAILHKRTDEKLTIVQQSTMFFVVQNYLKNCVLTNESLANNLILFFASYFDAPRNGTDINTFFNNIAKSNYSTMRSEFNDFKKEIIDIRTKKSVTILNEVMRSYQEVEIANFLYLNGIEYEYEPVYKYNIEFSRKPYTPDFIIRQGNKTAYIEHFGVTQSGHNNRFSDDELASYKKAVNDKILLHRQHGTTLIYTFSEFNDRRPLTDHLMELLLENGFELRPRSNIEVMEKLVSSEENRYIRKFVFLICRFIENFKANGFTQSEFNRMYHSTTNERTKLFLNICSECYLEYERYLKESNAIDFSDMINESARILREVKEVGEKLDFKYVIVDEYQDISHQRYDLVTAISQVCDAKIIAVGDDWQSIYAFSGSDITLFTEFEKKFGYANMLKIVNTYRNSQEVIDIAGGFIQQNPSQIQKDLKSPKNIKDPVLIYTYDSKRKKPDGVNGTGSNYYLAYAVKTALEQIMKYNKEEGKSRNSSILLLGRYGFDGEHLEKTGLFEYNKQESKVKCVEYPWLNITFMTAHASKGLGYDNVIIINGRNETYGFPSKIEDDPVLEFVIKGDRSIDYAEERRLFYVAMTRTKNRVFMIAPQQNPSEFMIEIKKNYKNVVLNGTWNEEYINTADFTKKCPICGYPLQYRYKNGYGLKLYICTNEPEICGFMTNKYGSGKLSICKCDKCTDGYLIVKSKKDGDYFLGCTNYKENKKGCNNIIWKNDYYNMMGYPFQHEELNYEGKTTEQKYLLKDIKKSNFISVEPTNKFHTVEIPSGEIIPVMYKENNLYDICYTIIKCLNHLSVNHFYGKNMLTDVLRGAKSKKITDRDLFLLPEYGKLDYITREEVILIIDWLIDIEFILQTKGKYPVLHPTYNGNHFNETMSIKLLKKLLKALNNED